MVVFTADRAPSLDETGMMDTPTFTEKGANDAPWTSEFAEQAEAAAHLTVPFHQEGAGGFSLVSIDFGPGFLLPRHSHSSDCLYYIVEGQIIMGKRELGPGDGFFLPAGQPYAYHAGPEGVKLLEFRHETSFDMKIYEKDMGRYRSKAAASMNAASSGDEVEPGPA